MRCTGYPCGSFETFNLFHAMVSGWYRQDLSSPCHVSIFNQRSSFWYFLFLFRIFAAVQPTIVRPFPMHRKFMIPLCLGAALPLWAFWSWIVWYLSTGSVWDPIFPNFCGLQGCEHHLGLEHRSRSNFTWFRGQVQQDYTHRSLGDMVLIPSNFVVSYAQSHNPNQGRILGIRFCTKCD